MPLVPEPFKLLSISRQSVALGSSPMAQSWCRFCPNLNIPQYRDSLSEREKRDLDQRATKLSRRAAINQHYKSSEFGWEVCAWHDVFGSILDDECLRMSVTPIYFLGTTRVI